MSLIEWQSLFEDVFESYPDKWALRCVYRHDSSQNRRLQNKRVMDRTGYARFHCPKCSNGWASAKAKITLYYPNYDEPIGTVLLRFYGQKCKKCDGRKLSFADPEFEVDWINLTLEKLYESIGCCFYGKQRPEKPKNDYNKVINIEGPHESKLCEACQLGRCDQMPRNKKNKT
ncbi:unnamed protein product [Rotaria socialis]|uniref:3CxxC-type domain-containing protein n=1 Tax=Rotaria socialis TaxID=392032 RepID=A0A817WCX5_9BILA|nr:unnamed protein product [Rotaria socialis]CAF4538944.1 unnamed protein product [Rotaria socialis]